MRRFRDEQEEQSGTIRRDPVGVRGRRDDQSAGEEAWGAPTNGAPGDRQFDPAWAKEARAGTTETRSGEGGYRPDAGRRPAGAAEATAHGTPHLDTAARRDRKGVRSRSQPCGDTCSNGSKIWDSAGGRCSCRRATTGARKVRWIGLRRWPNWMGNCASLQLFAMRSMASGDAFHRAYTNATQQALLEGHEHAFDYFGGVFRTLRYDN